jgi:hypothetical protein
VLAPDVAKDGELTVFLDVDTLVYSNITDALPRGADLVFTYRHAKFPINTGVIVVRHSDLIRAFFELWRDRTRSIYEDPAALHLARERNGAPSQDALWQLLDAPRPPIENEIKIEFPFGNMSFVGVPCSVLNEVERVPIKSGARIFHFKSRWHALLLDGKPDQTWPHEKAKEMYELWNAYRIDEERYIGASLLPFSTKFRNFKRRLTSVMA